MFVSEGLTLSRYPLAVELEELSVGGWANLTGTDERVRRGLSMVVGGGGVRQIHEGDGGEVILAENLRRQSLLFSLSHISLNEACTFLGRIIRGPCLTRNRCNVCPPTD